ncbi:MAG: hypothetical protein ACYTAF_10155 [Planctomycetota bacterium]|jgi:hypothetical protein
MRNTLTMLGAAICGALIVLCLQSTPEVSAQAGAPVRATTQGLPYLIASGGTQPNQLDLCWVLTKVRPAEGPERTVLAMYRAKGNGSFFDLEDTRMIDADLRVIELKHRQHDRNTTVSKILRSLPKPDQDGIWPPKKEEDRKRKTDP